MVVLVDCLEDVFGFLHVWGEEGGGVGFGEGFVGIAPFLGEVGPGDCAGEEADGGWEGMGEGGEGEGCFAGEG